jgi:hypothetical protein
LGIALGNRNIGIVRYLVVEKRMLLSAEKGLSVETLVQNLDLVLRILPEEVLDEQYLDQSETRNVSSGCESSIRPSSTSTAGAADNHGSAFLGEQESEIPAASPDRGSEDDGSVTSLDDEVSLFD